LLELADAPADNPWICRKKSVRKVLDVLVKTEN
jgi:hypothetical protein